MLSDSLNLRLPFDGWGIRRSDGRLVKFGAALLHSDGTADTLSCVGYSMGTTDHLTIGPCVTDHLHQPFVAARITASDSVTIAKILWLSWTGE